MTPPPASAFPADLLLTPIRRWPTTLPDATLRAVLARPVTAVAAAPLAVGAAPPAATIVVATSDNLPFMRLCLESVLANTGETPYEVVVVDNGSRDGTVAYLHGLAALHGRVRVVANEGNRGFAPAVNQGAAIAAGAILVLLNDDTIVPPGWLQRLVAHAADPAVGLVGAVSNRAGNEGEVETSYRTYGEMVEFARDRASRRAGQRFDVSVVTMFCAAVRRDVFDRLGPLDERFEIGLFEDDDYAMRVRAAGHRVICADDVFVHHFGQASIGKLSASAQYGPLFAANRRRWEEKWGEAWQPARRPRSDGYLQLIAQIREIVGALLPPGAGVLVASKGDNALLDLGEVRAGHFPQASGGGYSGFHPSDDGAAIAALEAVRATAQFLLFPGTAAWWLDHYAGLTRHLNATATRIWDSPECVVFQLVPAVVAAGAPPRSDRAPIRRP